MKDYELLVGVANIYSDCCQACPYVVYKTLKNGNGYPMCYKNMYDDCQNGTGCFDNEEDEE